MVCSEDVPCKEGKVCSCIPPLLLPLLLPPSFLQSQQEESGRVWERLRENTFPAGAKLMGCHCCVVERSHSAIDSAKLLSTGLHLQTDREEVVVSHREAPPTHTHTHTPYPLLITSVHSSSPHTLYLSQIILSPSHVSCCTVSLSCVPNHYRETHQYHRP